MGRLINVYNRFLTSPSSDDVVLGDHAPSANVVWKCAHVALWRTPWTGEPTAGSLDGGTVQIRINSSAVFEARMHGLVSQAKHAFSLVVPWGDGLRFTANETIGWYIAEWNLQGVIHAGFIGTHDPQMEV